MNFNNILVYAYTDNFISKLPAEANTNLLNQCGCTSASFCDHYFTMFNSTVPCTCRLTYDFLSTYLYCKKTDQLWILHVHRGNRWHKSLHESCKHEFIKYTYKKFVYQELYKIFYRLKLVEEYIMYDIIMHLIMHLITYLNLQLIAF